MKQETASNRLKRFMSAAGIEPSNKTASEYLQEIKVKKKMGRPSIGPQAMTPGQRQQRYRDRIKREADNLLKSIKAAV